MDHTREGTSDSASILSRSRVRLPSLKRFASQEHHNDKTPLLTVRLSSPSFLNTVVEDEMRLSLYTIKTAGNLTTVMRSDPWDGATKTADIRWPENAAALKGKGKKSSGVQVQMRGQRWVDEGSFLRAGSGSSSPRKFSVPNYSQSLKWRLIGTAYWCTSPSVKGPIAILEPAAGSLPLRLQVYETFRDKYDGRQISDHQGVSILLLDYILITSLLLVTDVRELMQMGREDQSDLTDTPTETSVPFERTGPCSTSGIPITSTPQWRKIMYGEPIYPKRRARSDSSESSPVGSTSHDNLTNVIHGVSSINFDSSSDSDPDNERSSSEPSPDLVPPTPPGTILLSGATVSSSQVCFHRSLNPDQRYQGDDEVQHQPLILLPLTPIRPYQSPTIDIAPISAYPYESRPPSCSSVSRPRSTPPQGQDHQPPPLPDISLLRNARSPSLPTTLLNRNTPARSRPLPRPPASSSAPTVRYAHSQQGPSPTTPLDKHGSRGLPSPPTQVSTGQQHIYPLEEAIDAGPAHLSQPLFHPSHARYPQFTSPFQSSKAPAENDLHPWMRGRSGTVTADAPPYDVPPPAYNTINFDE
ncbi:hypothetical protein JOM56_001638 [Amanita muscaria]